MDELKEKLATPGVGLFHFDDELETHVYTDFSSYGIAAVLAQVGPDGKERLCACISRSLNVHEAKYPSYYGELLAVTWALRTFHPYVWGRHIKVITDHQPLVWLISVDVGANLIPRRAVPIKDAYVAGIGTYTVILVSADRDTRPVSRKRH